MRTIDADVFGKYLADWQMNMRNAGECGGCEAELLGKVMKALDEQPTVESVTLEIDTKLMTKLILQANEQLQKVSMREQLMTTLASLTDLDYARACFDVVKTEANVYAVDVECIRMERACKLIASGHSRKDVLAALETHTDAALDLRGR